MILIFESPDSNKTGGIKIQHVPEQTALVLEAGGPRGHVPPHFLERGHRGAPCCEGMYYEVCSPQEMNAMFSQNRSLCKEEERELM